MATQSFSAVRVSNSSPTANQSVGFWYDLSNIIKVYDSQYYNDGLLSEELARINSIEFKLQFDAHNNEGSESMPRSMQAVAQFVSSSQNAYGQSYGSSNCDYSISPGSQSIELSFQISADYVASSSYKYLYISLKPDSSWNSYVWIMNAPTVSVTYTAPEAATDPGSGDSSPTSYSAQVSIVTPYGGTKEYGSTVNFGFDVQTNGTLTEWRAQYSTNDGYSWDSLPVSNVTTNSDNGPIEVRFTSGTTFPVGTIRWRVQVRVNGQSYGSTWTSASFTVAENTVGGSGSSSDVIVPVKYDNGEIVVIDIDGNGSDDSTIYAVSCSIIQPSNGSKRSGSADIPFKFSVRSSGRPTEYQAEYSTDEGLTWNALAQDSINSGQNEIIFTVPRMTLPSGPIEWRVRARANGDWQYDWTSTSFTVTYDGYGSIQATSGPINSGILGTSSIRYDATMQIIGETIGQPTLIEARFRWRSGDSSDYIERSMIISNNSAYIIIPVDTFPYGLIQWYMYGKDSSGIESETPVYATYILKSAIDSFPIKPVSSIEQSENAIEFKWGYISLNGQNLKKYEFQFSEDGVTWGASVSYDTVEDLEEEAPLIPPSGEDVFEEEVGE